MASDAPAKYDIKKAHKRLYAPSAKGFEVVEVPELSYLAVDGHGDPNTSSGYADAVEALYSVSYGIKFASKRELDRDFVVGPLEGLWWAEDMSTFLTRDKSAWDWTMLIVQPDWITAEMVHTAIEKAEGKKQLPPVELRRISEGTSAQILHIGAYDDEGPTLDRLHHEYLPQHGLTFNGHHHEIYLSDPRRTAPEKLKTVLRQPVRPA
ncbi:GyrI-like domain-containing protein [Diaminobutyricimonas aerilata]|nr:GyrI-like domain-containing protein [Diaminobutyricimonas aerilata]